MTPTKDKDLDLWKAWKASRSQYDLEALLKQMAPVMRLNPKRGFRRGCF